MAERLVATGPGPGLASLLHSTLLVHCSQGGLQGAALSNRTLASCPIIHLQCPVQGY